MHGAAGGANVRNGNGRNDEPATGRGYALIAKSRLRAAARDASGQGLPTAAERRTPAGGKQGYDSARRLLLKNLPHGIFFNRGDFKIF